VPAYAAAHCLTDLTAFRLTTKELNNYMGAHPDFTIDIVHSLNKEIRSTIAGFWGMGSTPLLEQKASDLKGAAFYAPAVAAAIESFYRSALAGVLVTRLNPGQPLVLFPNMQVRPLARENCYFLVPPSTHSLTTPPPPPPPPPPSLPPPSHSIRLSARLSLLFLTSACG
jgi:hypothetical protein